jgi:hypothetical protein
MRYFIRGKADHVCAFAEDNEHKTVSRVCLNRQDDSSFYPSSWRLLGNNEFQSHVPWSIQYSHTIEISESKYKMLHKLYWFENDNNW